jgi:hypothetical protein
MFKEATLFFSHNSIPNIATVIPAMDCIDKVLISNSADADLSVSIRTAVVIGAKTLNRYYSKTDMSEIYRTTMSEWLLHVSINFPTCTSAVQFCILDTSLSTSGMLAGMTTGSRRRTTWSATSSIPRMARCMDRETISMRSTVTLMKMYAPLFYLMFINDLSKIITSDLPTRPHNSFDDLPSYSTACYNFNHNSIGQCPISDVHNATTFNDNHCNNM